MPKTITITNKHIARYATTNENPIEKALTEKLGFPVEVGPHLIYQKNPYVKNPLHHTAIGFFTTDKVTKMVFAIMFNDVRNIKPLTFNFFLFVDAEITP